MATVAMAARAKVAWIAVRIHDRGPWRSMASGHDSQDGLEVGRARVPIRPVGAWVADHRAVHDARRGARRAAVAGVGQTPHVTELVVDEPTAHVVEPRAGAEHEIDIGPLRVPVVSLLIEHRVGMPDTVPVTGRKAAGVAPVPAVVHLDLDRPSGGGIVRAAMVIGDPQVDAPVAQ